ncbi:MAG TPA: phosphoglycerate dehydrogenase [Candidatus Dormibacteraeota bacterium]|nr:phosphoglycerate dehydrogenase [Candidatus Dormibacteraeota bacterium]
MNRTVLATATFFDEAAIAFLQAHNCEVVLSGMSPGTPDTSLSRERIFELLRNANAWIVATAPVSREMLETFPNLRVIAKRGVGYDQIDVAAAKELGRVVTYAPGGNGPSVADHTIALMLAVAKRLCEFRELMRAGDWSVQPVTELYRKTVGLIGLGRIGRDVAQRLKGFETTILAFDEKPDRQFASANGIRLVDLPTLFREGDYISLHLPLMPSSRNLIDEAALAHMKSTAIIINTARGGLIDEKALLRALQGNRIGGAGLDVFLGEQEPASRSVSEELIALPNVVSTPHVAGASREGLMRGNLLAAQGIVAVLDGGTPAAECLVVDGRTSAQ